MQYREFKEAVRKRPAEPFWLSRLFWRHFTIPFSWVCSRLHVTADQITVLSLIVGMAGGLCFCWPTVWAYVGGVVLIQGWSFFDHVDGELGRYEVTCLHRKSSLAGPYLDLLVHRWVQPFYHVCMSIGIVRLTGDWGWLLLGWFAGANYFGFAKSQADSLVLRSMVHGSTSKDNPAVLDLLDLTNVLPGANRGERSGLRRLIDWSKQVKSWFAFPGCLVLLCVVVAIDTLVFGMNFPRVAGVPASATVVYLILQACIALGQNVAGTWYVATLLRKVP